MASTGKKAIAKTGSKATDKPPQLALFELLDSSESDYSNTIELYDALPKYVWANTELDLRENSVITRQLKSRGAVYTIKIKPAVVERTNDAGETVSVMLYPGSREEIVEEALRKIAVNGNSFESPDDKEVGVYFTISQLRKELARTKHSYSAQEVQEALDVMSSSLLECSTGSGKGRNSYRGNLLPKLAITTREDYLSDGSARCFATFHPLVTLGVKTQAFRMYDYSISMGLKSDLARYIYKRISHYWTQASLNHPYQPKLVSFLEQSPRGLSERMKDNMRAMRTALNSLAEQNVILPGWNEMIIKDDHDKRVTKDIQFEILPHDNFIKHMMRANKKASDIKGKTGIADAKDAVKGKNVIESSAGATHNIGAEGSFPEDGSDQVFD
ncbi:replication protein [Pseudomonas sp. AP19]|mgnify:CR=1 FL=1|uniref:replication protein n=1 Tax=Pseudomonas sp. AP19 TaxID=1535623 RepID=UPI00084BBE73|nr:replication protein [Pseudomonas sp. AP19]OEC65684.1 replication protein [Pseudomonas sp. AP19]